MFRRTIFIFERDALMDFLPAFFSAAVGTSKTGSPSNVTRPEVGSSRRRMTLPRVVFPQPDSPTSPSVSPVAHRN